MRANEYEIDSTIDEAKEKILGILIERGWPTDEAQLIVDLAAHATAEVQRILLDITSRTTTSVGAVQATCIACEFVLSRVADIKEFSINFMEQHLSGNDETGDFNDDTGEGDQSPQDTPPPVENAPQAGEIAETGRVAE